MAVPYHLMMLPTSFRRGTLRVSHQRYFRSACRSRTSLSIGCPVTRDVPLVDVPREVIWMYRGAQVPGTCVLHVHSRSFEPASIDEINRAVRPRAPDVRRNSVDDEPEAIFTLLQGRVEILQASDGVVEYPPKVGEFVFSRNRDFMLKVAPC